MLRSSLYIVVLLLSIGLEVVQSLPYSTAPKPSVRTGRINLTSASGDNACGSDVIKCDDTALYRTVDGSCNNLKNPEWGMSLTPFKRFLSPQYDDGIRSPRIRGVDGSPLPSPRLVSTTIHSSDALIPALQDTSHMVMQWGQFLDHDLTLAPVQTGTDGLPLTCCPDDMPPNLRGTHDTRLRDVFLSMRLSVQHSRGGCFPIDVPSSDRHFKTTCLQFPRSIQVDSTNCAGLQAEQLNQLTAYIDASDIYGSDKKDADSLRVFVDGLMKTSDGNLLPYDNDTPEVCTDTCFRSGDRRVNEQIGLTSMHTIFLREHNRIARSLVQINPHWNDETIYQETRKIIGAVVQKITFSDFLPMVLDTYTMHTFGLSSYTEGYDDTVNAGIRNSFSTVAFRFGHSLIRSIFSRRDQSFSVNKAELLRDLFTITRLITSTHGEAGHELLRGQLADRSERVDRFLTPEITDFLFLSGNESLDLAALNIQRGRDHGLPGYTAWRKWCGLSTVYHFRSSIGGLVDHDAYTASRLEIVYRHPEDIDLFTGGVAELPLRGGLVGPMFSCILGNQFPRTKTGDRFWFELGNQPTSFSLSQLEEIRKVTLSRLLCDNSNTFYIQANAFLSLSTQNRLMPCHSITRPDLSKWARRPIDEWREWSPWSACQHWVRFSQRTRICRTERQRCLGNSTEVRKCWMNPPPPPRFWSLKPFWM